MCLADDGEIQDEVAAAEPSIDEKTNKLVSKGRWVVPGYKVRHLTSTTRSFRFAVLTRPAGAFRRPFAAISNWSATFPCVLLLHCHCR